MNRALLELARTPSSVSALLEAADASLAVDDFDAALGFYARAGELAPGDARVILGTARVYLQSGRPIEALPLFDEALRTGAGPREVLTDQALAFDLVGDQAAAQSAYLRAIELNPDDNEARRRLAVSYAISGNTAGFQSTLDPLLEARDFAAFRARAFGLAILGEQARAAAIVEQVMPRDLALRINPYLEFMPRLTPSQQAAAANLGIFPRAADIGREDPRIARFAAEGAAGSRLEPAGAPLGTPAAVQSPLQASVPAPVQAPATPRPQENVDAAFADLGDADLPDGGAAQGAVDLTQIEIPIEPESRTQNETGPPHPRRIWVQVATGRDVEALRFDWRRLERRAPELLGGFVPHVTPWGQANRLLAGPLANRDDARDLINALAERGIETFSYISQEGVEVQPLD